MTNIIANVAAVLLVVTTTNWSVVGNLNLVVEQRSLQVQEGIIYTNTYVAFPWHGTNHWRLLSTEAGATLPERRLLERTEMQPAHAPPPLPLNYAPRSMTQTNVGTVTFK